MSVTARRVAAVFGGGLLLLWIAVLVEDGWDASGRLPDEVVLPLVAGGLLWAAAGRRPRRASAAAHALGPATGGGDDPENAPPPFTAPLAGARAGGAVITPMGDYELRVHDDELAALILPPRGLRQHLRILTGEGSWSVRPVGGRWSFAARREQDREPVAVFQRRRLRASGLFTVRGGTQLHLRRRTRRRDWTLRDGDRDLLVLSAPRDRHREQIMRFERLGECPAQALLVPFAMWVAIEIDRHDRRLWRHDRRDDPDRLADAWWGGDAGGGGGDSGGD